MKESYIDEQGVEAFYNDFNEKGNEILEKYDNIQSALEVGAENIKGVTQGELSEASSNVSKIKERIKDLLLRYNACMSDSIESMAGLDSGAVSKMKGELANLSEGVKKRSGSGGGSSGGGSNGGSSGGGSNGGSSGGGNGTGGGSNGGSSGGNGNNQTDPNNNEAKNPYKPSDENRKKHGNEDPNSKYNGDIDARIKELREKMRAMQEELRKKPEKGDNGKDGKNGNYGKDGNSGKDGKNGNSGRDGTSVRDGKDYYRDRGGSETPIYTPTTGDTPSTGTNFKNPTDNNVGTGSELGTTTNDKDSLEKMSTGTEAETPNLEDGEVIEEGNLTDVSPTDLSDENLELGATDDTLVSEDKSGSNNLLKFAGIGGMLLGSGALAAGLATKKDEEELSTEETTEEASDELEDEYSQELKDFYE